MQELQVVVSRLTWVLGTEPRSSIRAARALNHRAVSGAPPSVLAGLSSVPASGGLVGVYNGKSLVFEESSWFVINVIKLVWRYGFQSLRMHMWVEDLLDKFMR
jgi:hypothetical protein